MSLLLIIIHVIVCIALIMIVLLQTGKGADMGAAFGGGSGHTLFGSTGASTFLTKATTAAAIIFMLTSLGLAYMSGNKTGDSIMIDTKTPIEQHAEPEKNLPVQEPVQKEEATKTAPASEPEASQPDVPVQTEKSSQS
jgi:preprotein translocase subunit SecG